MVSDLQIKQMDMACNISCHWSQTCYNKLLGQIPVQSCVIDFNVFVRHRCYQCKIYEFYGATQNRFQGTLTRSILILTVIFTDICTPMRFYVLILNEGTITFISSMARWLKIIIHKCSVFFLSLCLHISQLT